MQAYLMHLGEHVGPQEDQAFAIAALSGTSCWVGRANNC